MLQYRRRNSSAPAPQRDRSVPALVGLCNWSYDPSRHIDTDRLRRILSSYSPEYTHIYLRIFNEATPQMLATFLDVAQLDTSALATIYERLRQRGFDLRNLDEILAR